MIQFFLTYNYAKIIYVFGRKHFYPSQTRHLYINREETRLGRISFAVKELGFDKDKTAILGYHLVRLYYEGRKGAFKDILDILKAAVKTTDKTKEAVEQLKNYGAPVEMPKKGKDAVKQSLTSIGLDASLLK